MGRLRGKERLPASSWLPWETVWCYLDSRRWLHPQARHPVLTLYLPHLSPQPHPIHQSISKFGPLHLQLPHHCHQGQATTTSCLPTLPVPVLMSPVLAHGTGEWDPVSIVLTALQCFLTTGDNSSPEPSPLPRLSSFPDSGSA